MAPSDSTKKQIDEIVRGSPVVLFMKGNRQFPQCGFSAQVVEILNGLLSEYATVNVLADPALRDAIKEYSSWPTIPQLYVKGEFVGGCDIVREMYASGELHKVLGLEAVETPAISVTARAASAFRQAAEEADAGDVLHLEISSSFQYELYFAPKRPGQIEVDAGTLKVWLDRPSAARADGMAIDFVDQPGGGFKLDNPNEPPRVRPLTAQELKAMLDRGDAFELFDVRTEAERKIARIDRAHWLEADDGKQRLEELDRGARVVFHCHHGIRSRTAAELALRAGFRNVYNLEGGIDAWSKVIDPAVPRY